MQNQLCSDQELQELLSATKIQLMTKQGSMFLSNVSMLLDHRFSTEVPTAATDGKSIVYNPNFFFKLTKEERVGLIAHECWHICYLHMFRRGDRDPQLWNMAADYVINDLLIVNNFKLPPEGLHDPKYRNMSTEQVYELLIQEAQEPPPNYNQDLECKVSEEQENEVTNIVIQAASRTSMDHGNIPKEVLIAIQDLINPKLNWKELLYRFVDEKCRDDYSWSKP